MVHRGCQGGFVSAMLFMSSVGTDTMVKLFFEINFYPGLGRFSEHVTVVEISVCHAQRNANVTRNSQRGGSFRSFVRRIGSKRSSDTVG